MIIGVLLVDSTFAELGGSLSVARWGLAAASVGNKIVFAGGLTYSSSLAERVCSLPVATKESMSVR